MTTDLREKMAEVLAGHEARPSRVVGDTLRPRPAVTVCACGKWSTPYDQFGEPEVADHRRHVAEAILAAIGDRVLPEGGETHEERGVVHDDLGEFHRCTAWATCTQWFPHVHGHTHTVTTWPDGTTLTGPWRPVDTEDPRRALTEGQADG